MKDKEDYLEELKYDFEKETGISKSDLGYDSKYIEWLEEQLYYIDTEVL